MTGAKPRAILTTLESIPNRGAKHMWDYILDSYGMENTLTDEGS
jgi:hypothetical protein